jgi:predicted nicotinamide N-methyase
MASLRIRYQTIEFGDMDIHVCTLRDKQQFSDDDNVAGKLGISSASWPIFGTVWASGEVLAHLMCDYQIAGKRILEVGCGIGLSSLLLNHRMADITATDYHPEAGNFLAENARLNRDRAIPFMRTGWGDADCGLGKFDLIIGSDLLYERDHVELLADFIEQHAKPLCEVIIVDPGRGNAARYSKKMVSLGYVHSQSRPENRDLPTQPFPRGHILRYQRQ